jgi:carbamoyl-phosphate synthase large subunit
MPAIQKICRNENVKLIVPTIDTELMVFSESSASFAKQNIRVAVPPPTFVAMARDKMGTARFLKTCGVGTPQTWQADDPASPPPTTAYPLIAKPRHGSASIGVQSLANNAERLRFLASLGAPDKKNYVLQTLCTGRELTVNAFYREGKLVCAVPHHRKFVRAVQTAAAAIARGFAGLAGVICFQGFENDSAFTVTEINARFGGGYPLADAAGGRFARWLIQDTLELTPDDTPEYQVGLRMLRYDAAVFVPPTAK